MDKPKIIAYSDNICPFCYVGAKRIEKLKQEVDFDIEWRAFEIHPDTPKDGVAINDYFRGYNMDAAKNYLESFGKDVEMKMSNVTLANSHRSLMANEFANKHNKQDEFLMAIFKAYFEDGKNIGSMEVVLKIGESIGLDKEKLKVYLESEEAEQAIEASSNEARELGITGVPTFIIGDKMIVGAQSYKVLKESITK
ncbi:MAG: DsbA family oxidoreductase [Candidatus Marinimicrobia bacterium]|nr:DsbA family oxidoreductase [Candidatus Neomarinimicrobiota bacterium]MCH7763806.1 DsbA family oxidoreductase [Candidatus Neomarinimicrobiota bacterium]